MRPVRSREIPGPAGLSKEKEGDVIAGETQKKEDSFKSVSWLSLNKSLGYTDNEIDKRETIAQVLQGKFDLRVPRLAVIVDKVLQT
jgi:hypothetical protein